jgi:hypothetical protein
MHVRKIGIDADEGHEAVVDDTGSEHAP